MSTKRQIRGKLPKAPKDAGGKMKPFLVAQHANIFGEDINGQSRKILGSAEYDEDRTVMLSETMANHFANLGYIEVEVDFDDADAEALQKAEAENDELRRKIAALEAATAESELDPPAENRKAEGATVEDEQGDTSDSEGGKPSDGLGSGSGDETSKRGSSRRRRSL